MDSLTHIAIGACIGEAFWGKSIGKKTMFWGAVSQSVPDIDFIAGFWMPLSEELLAHRGFTHSFLFVVLMTPLLALIADRIHLPNVSTLKKWMLFFIAEMLIHVFLDGFNNYGTAWFEPCSHHRFSFNTLYVADPFFSIWPGIAAFIMLVTPMLSVRRRFWWKFGIYIPAIYLCYAIVNKLNIDRDTRQILAAQNIPAKRYFTTPTPLNNWLWFVVAGNDSGYHVGFRSVFDRQKKIDFQYFPRNAHYLDSIADHDDVKNLVRFSQEFYTVEKRGDSLVFNDLRFGQIIGWHDPRQKFVFHYYLTHPEDNEIIVQRGRFAGWNKETAMSLVRRIRGN